MDRILKMNRECYFADRENAKTLVRDRALVIQGDTEWTCDLYAQRFLTICSIEQC